MYFQFSQLHPHQLDIDPLPHPLCSITSTSIIRWHFPFLFQLFPACVFPIQPTAPLTNLLVVHPLPHPLCSIASTSIFSTYLVCIIPCYLNRSQPLHLFPTEPSTLTNLILTLFPVPSVQSRRRVSTAGIISFYLNHSPPLSFQFNQQLHPHQLDIDPLPHPPLFQSRCRFKFSPHPSGFFSQSFHIVSNNEPKKKKRNGHHS